MRCISIVTIVLIWAASPLLARGGDLDFGDLKTIRVVPRTLEEIAQAHDRSRGNACEPVPPEQLLEVRDFMPILTDRDSAEFDRGQLLLPSSRRHMFTVGLDMLSDDKAHLPKVSNGQILAYIQSNYVTVQARVQRDPGTGELFLHHRPLAATISFRRGTLTKEFNEAVLAAIREFHSLGVYLPSGTPQRPKNLRTLVMIYRSLVAPATITPGKTPLKPLYEYVFIRAREVPNSHPPQLNLHVFATSDERQRLHLLNPWSPPDRANNCGVHAMVVFTEYSTLGLIPTKSATRRVSYSSKQVVPWEDLNRFVTEQHWRGDALDNLDQTLDAYIDQKIQVSSNTRTGSK